MSELRAKFQPLDDPRQVDLRRHALIEASAGTGKTYTIERVVLRGLVEMRLPLMRILAVTFTEKATGELKDRIRRMLEWIVDSASGMKGEDADSLWLAQQYEKQGSSLLDRASTALDRFDEASIFTIHGFCQSVLRDYAFDLGRLLQYEVVDDRQVLGIVLQERFRRWPAEQTSRLRPLLEQGHFWKRTGGYGGAVQYRWDSLLRELGVRVRPGDDLRLPGAADESLAFFRDTIWQLQDEARRYKAERGWISYDDMIRLVRDAVLGRSFVAAALRDRFRLAVVDEFQDTDSHQWDIFRTVFLEADGSSLVLVGDPKQSIYGFRGADVNAYLTARSCLADLASKGTASLYRLDRNFRSTDSFVRACNHLFNEWKWSAGSNAEIDFVPSRAAGAWGGTIPPVGRYAMNLWDAPSPGGSPGDIGAAAAWRAFVGFIVREIRRLIAAGWRIEAVGAASRRFHYGDVAVLVSKHSEALRIMDELRSAGIPATFYKQKGVFDSCEALEILYVLEAIADPGRQSAFQKALLTRFFGFDDPGRLREVDEMAVDDPVRLRLQQWQELASQSRWSLLFRSFLAHPDSPVGRMATDRVAGWERSLTNFEQILLALEEEGLRRGLDLPGMIRALKARMEGQADLEEEDTLHRQETEEDCVRVLTMHASKGLEFPVVFVAGGMTESSRSPWYEFFEDGRRVHGLRSLSASSGARSEGLDVDDWKVRHKKRQQEEQARLYYVALTRAGIMAYVPFYRPKRAQSLGPLCTLVYDAIQSAYSALSEHDAGLMGFVSDDESASPSLSLPSMTSEIRRGSEPPAVQLPARLRERRSELVSYSSLATHHSASPRVDAEVVDRMDDSEADWTGEDSFDEAQGAFSTNADSSAILSAELDRRFRGAAAGNLFHEILERLDYQDPVFLADRADLDSFTGANQRLIRYRLRSYGYDGSTEEAEVAALLHRVLCTDLLPGFRLRDLSPGNRLHEMEFLLDSGPTGRAQETFLTGFIDMLFSHGGKIYLLDWKTNLLEDYGARSLHRCMRAMQYDLQYSLYAQAVNGWLRSARPGTELAGIFYLFLRGMQPGSQNGIYFVQPRPDDLARTVSEVLRPGVLRAGVVGQGVAGE